MNTKIFVDSNIWLYAIIGIEDYKKHMRASDLILKNKNIFISTQVIREITVNLLKKTNIGEDFVHKFVVDAYMNYKVAFLNEKVYLKAYSLRYDYDFSYWDSIIVASALLSECNVLYSDVLSDKLVFEDNIKIINPFK